MSAQKAIQTHANTEVWDSIENLENLSHSELPNNWGGELKQMESYREQGQRSSGDVIIFYI